jgi:cytochrome c oxidase assembly protein subunit 15
LGFAALAALVYAIAIIPIKRIRALAALQLLGIIAQAILGGITVLTGLHPTTVVAHLLVSIVLIAGALSLRQRVYGAIPSQNIPTLLTKRLLKGLVGTGFAVVVMGSIVTGTGPHSGDSDSSRFDFDVRILFIGLLFATLLAVHLGENGATRTSLIKKISCVIGLSLAQGALGYLQWFTGVPEFLVALHLIGAVSVWLSLWNLYITGSVSSPVISSKGAN